MSEKLTKRLIDSFVYVRQDGRKDIRWDTEMKGFGIRIYPSGQKSFVLSYRQDGRKRLYTVGQYGKITLEQAKELARKRFGEVADGKDPVLVRKARKKKHEWTVQRAFDNFLKRYPEDDNNRHRDEIERIFEKDILPALGKKPIDEVSKDDVLKIIDGIMERGACIMANRTLSRMSKFFDWCVERNLIQFSPVYKISKPAKENSRERILSDAELKEIWEACSVLRYPFGPVMKLLILTGQRRGEAAALQWGDYDEERKLWILPRETTKSDRSHEVPLSNMAIEILESIPNMGDYVFTSSSERPFENFSRDKRVLDSKLKERRAENGQPPMPPWTIHDLRRTAASGMARLGVAPHVVEKILNHSSGTISGVAAVYNRYKYADEMRDALDRWAGHVWKVLTEETIAKSIVRIPKKISQLTY